MSWNTFGHNHVKRILELQSNSKIFSHAYLFLGSEFLGKKMLSLEFAKKILNAEKLENHPDFAMLDEEEVSIERLREFMENLSFKPFLGAYKVAIINNAEKLNLQSQNALLKTLEEPSQSTILILISSRALIPTILSRCQVMRFNRCSQKQMREFLESAKIKRSEEVLVNAFGLPGKIMADEKTQTGSIKEWQALKFFSRGEKLAQISKWAEKESEDLGKILALSLQGEILNLGHEPKSFRLAELLLEAIESLRKNFNKKMVLQKLFLNL